MEAARLSHGWSKWAEASVWGDDQGASNFVGEVNQSSAPAASSWSYGSCWGDKGNG